MFGIDPHHHYMLITCDLFSWKQLLFSFQTKIGDKGTIATNLEPRIGVFQHPGGGLGQRTVRAVVQTRISDDELDVLTEVGAREVALFAKIFAHCLQQTVVNNRSLWQGG